jgi:hypothetical protein
MRYKRILYFMPQIARCVSPALKMMRSNLIRFYQNIHVQYKTYFPSVWFRASCARVSKKIKLRKIFYMISHKAIIMNILPQTQISNPKKTWKIDKRSTFNRNLEEKKNKNIKPDNGALKFHLLW